MDKRSWNAWNVICLPFFRPFFTADNKHDGLNGKHDQTITNHEHQTHSADMSSDDKSKTSKPILILISIFVISLMAMFYVYLMFPELDEYVAHFLPLHFVFISFDLGRFLNNGYFVGFFGIDRRKSMLNFHGTSKMLRNWAKYSTGTRICTILKWCRLWLSFIFCKFVLWKNWQYYRLLYVNLSAAV